MFTVFNLVIVIGQKIPSRKGWQKKLIVLGMIFAFINDIVFFLNGKVSNTIDNSRIYTSGVLRRRK